VTTPLRCSGMTRVLKGSHIYQHTPRSFANGMNHTLPLPSQPKPPATITLLYHKLRHGLARNIHSYITPITPVYSTGVISARFGLHIRPKSPLSRLKRTTYQKSKTHLLRANDGLCPYLIWYGLTSQPRVAPHICRFAITESCIAKLRCNLIEARTS